MQMQTQAPPPNTGPREFLSRMLAQSSAGQAEPLEVNGLQGYTTIVRSARTDFGIVPARYAVIYYNNLAYVFAGASKGSAGTPSADPLFMSTIKTFRRLKQNEFAQAEPYKIKIIRATENTRIADLAKHVAAAEVRRTAAAAAERPVPGQGAEAGSAHQDRRIDPTRAIARAGDAARCAPAACLIAAAAVV